MKHLQEPSLRYPLSKQRWTNQLIFSGQKKIPTRNIRQKCNYQPTLSSWQFVAIWFWSTVSTSGSIMACFLMQLMLNPYTLFQTDVENENEIYVNTTNKLMLFLSSCKVRNFKQLTSIFVITCKKEWRIKIIN